ncbi:MarR family transcriptional regulator [Natranaerovirga pectinivora]|uniref:MarR family transcriptional regulator n=1 Tax=Natranaerovirga pectinivora TaxID=682400 RepID=A0A4R3MGZ5_9FIRM|nr:MarR family transcriptional regulator [Natranaerovirga pectinivora]TCT11639.1 MarR family transcriptional regulator [Natranaerovirga pectinivora]
MSYNREESLNYLLTKVFKLRHIKLHTMLTELGMHPGQHSILFLLWEKDGQTQKELCNGVMIKPSSITVVLGRMEKSGLITRKTDVDDKRVSRVYLTEKGKKIQKEVEEALMKIEEKCYGNFTETEKKQYKDFLLRIKANLEKK